MGLGILGSHSSDLFPRLPQGSAQLQLQPPQCQADRGTWGWVLLPQLVPTLLLQWFLWRRSFLLRCERCSPGGSPVLSTCWLCQGREGGWGQRKKSRRRCGWGGVGISFTLSPNPPQLSRFLFIVMNNNTKAWYLFPSEFLFTD